MQHQVHTKRLLGLTAAALICAVPAGCGGSSNGPTASNPASTGSATTIASSAAGSGAAQPQSGALRFATCMRANGVSSFPDPAAGGGVQFPIPAGTNPEAPAFQAARAKCQKYLGGGLPGPGSTTHPSAQTLSKLVRIARCMRAHGVPQFPDPQTSVPSNPVGIAEITDFDGAILLFPATLNMQAPAYRQALTACGAPPLGLRH
jgi:hypothetical protein